MFARKEGNCSLRTIISVCAQTKKTNMKKKTDERGLNLSRKGLKATTQEKLVMVRNEMRSEIGVGVIAVKN